MQKENNMGMFTSLAKIADSICSVLTYIKNIQTKAEREKAILDILKTYFLLKDIVDDGTRLLSSAGTDPVGKISEMEAADAIKTLTAWDLIVQRQGNRLFTLRNYIFGEHHLSVINPALQERITEIIGDKMDRTITLHQIGAALFFRNMFPIADNEKERIKYVELLLDASEDGTINVVRASSEIEDLEQSLSAYRQVIERLVSSEELVALSARARQETLMAKRDA